MVGSAYACINDELSGVSHYKHDEVAHPSPPLSQRDTPFILAIHYRRENGVSLRGAIALRLMIRSALS